jgi:hypothetical protein
VVVLTISQQHSDVLRTKVRNGKLYRSDEKLAIWLNIPVEEVPAVVESLVEAGVLTFAGMSSKNTEIYRLPLSSESGEFHRLLVANASVSGVVNAPTLGKLSELTGVPISQVRSAWDELQLHGFVGEQRFGTRLLPVVKVWEPEGQS